MVRAMTAVALVMALGACSENYGGATGGMDGYAREEMQSATAPAAPPMASKADYAEAPMDMDSPVVQPEPGGGSGGAEPGTAPLMAYTYNWNFAVPTEGMQGLQNAHKKLCEDAGPANCYVTNSYLNAIGRKEGANGSLSMRATEAWVRKFETGVDAGLKQFAASVYSTNRAAEELTAQIVDTEARLTSMRAHRDALQKMLADRPGKLSDLLEIQQALAQVQGEIDARSSVVAALRLRVSMSELTFSYQAEYAAAAQSIWRPVTDAFGDFAPSFAGTIAGLIRFVAAILPLAIIVGLLALVGMVFYRRSGMKGFPPRRAGAVLAPAQAPPAPEKATSEGKPPIGPAGGP